MEEGHVRAAGGVVWRDGANGLEVLLVHRPRYDDWTFPKGKAEGGETDEDCALREVEEETGLRCALGAELPSTSYRDSLGRPKVVRWWAMEPAGGELRAATEADETRWVPLEGAARLLSYGRDRELARTFAEGRRA